MTERREAYGWNYSLEHVEVEGDAFTIMDVGLKSVFQRSSGVLLEFAILEQGENGTLIGEVLDFALVPEFPSLLVPALLMITTMPAIIVCRRKLKRDYQKKERTHDVARVE